MVIGNERANILVVDDQPAKLLTYEAILKDLDENLIKAGSAREALDHLLKTDIAVVLMDVCMPDVDGFELASLIRQHPRCQKTAIILVSAVLMTDFDRLKGFEHGAVDYISVPIVPEILRARVAVFADLYRKTVQFERLNAELERRVAERTADLEASTARLQESETEHRMTLESALDCVIKMDHEGKLVGFNGAAERTFGYRRDDVKGLSLADVLLPERFRIDYQRGLARLLETGQSNLIGRRVEMPALRADGTEILVEISINANYPLERPDQPVFTGFLRDVTELQRVQAEKADLLESERLARTEAERANRFKDEFLAMVSHEVRAPLNAVLLWAQLLKRDPEDKAALVEGLDAIERSAKAQARLIEDLLDMSRIISGKIQLEPQIVALDPIIEAVIATIRPVADSQEVEIRQHLDPMAGLIWGDPTRLQQIVWNLFSNAVKFTPQGGRVEVELAQIDSSVEIKVCDTGQGITQEFLPYVFDSFRQADGSTTRRHGGLGLGLAISKHLVELHNGTIEAASPGEGQGTTVRVRLPLASGTIRDAAPPHVSPMETPAGKELANRRVLVVDDDPDGCEVLRRILVECDACVEIATSVDHALSIIGTFQPDILVSDIGMPGKDGYELIHDVRQFASGAVRVVPAVAMTAFAHPQDRIHALQAGYDMYVSKPVDRRELLRVLSAVIRSATSPTRTRT